MTQFSNAQIECHIVFEGQLHPLKSVTVSSFSLYATTPPKRSMTGGQWEDRAGQVQQRQLQIQLNMLKHDDIADVMLEQAAIFGTALHMHFTLNTTTALRAYMHIQQYRYDTTQNDFATITARCINLGEVMVVG